MLSPDLVLPTPLNDIFSVASLTVTESGINAEAGAEPCRPSPPRRAWSSRSTARS